GVAVLVDGDEHSLEQVGVGGHRHAGVPRSGDARVAVRGVPDVAALEVETDEATDGPHDLDENVPLHGDGTRRRIDDPAGASVDQEVAQAVEYGRDLGVGRARLVHREQCVHRVLVISHGLRL